MTVPPIFLATLGMRPAAVMMAFEKLTISYAYDMLGLIVTDPHQSEIAASFQQLRQAFSVSYPTVTFATHVIHGANDEPLLDIDNDASAEAYYRAILAVLKQYRQQGDKVHLLVAGGRKAMSIYATLAASLIFRHEDIVWTILSSPEVVDRGNLHLLPEQVAQVQMVRLPLLPSRFLTSRLPDLDVDALLSTHDDPRERFLADLSAAERALADMVAQHPYASYAELGKFLQKAPKTVENQLSNIYMKMLPYFDLSNIQHKKNALLDVMAGRL